jgi:hypothetical protein
MPEQEVNPIAEGSRNPDGTFAKGHSGHPGGGARRGYQPAHVRSKVLQERYTPREIVEIASDREKLLDLENTMDAILIPQIASSIIEQDIRLRAQERETLLDRSDGRAKQTIELPPPPDIVSPEQRMLDTARKIAFLLSRGLVAQTIVGSLETTHKIEGTDDLGGGGKAAELHGAGEG